MLVLGRRLRTRRLGFVADYCLFCREIARCEFQAVSEVSHVYFISLSAGRLLAHQTRCSRCGTIAGTVPELFEHVARRDADLQSLIAQTQPDVAERNELEYALDRGETLDTATRRYLLLRRFLAIAPQLEQRCGSTHIDYARGGLMAAMAAGVVILFILEVALRPQGSEEWFLPWGLIGYAYLGLGVTLLGLLATDVGRFVRKQILPRLARALTPLVPRGDELREALDRTKAFGYQIGHKIPLKKLTAAMTEYAESSPTQRPPAPPMPPPVPANSSS